MTQDQSKGTRKYSSEWGRSDDPGKVITATRPSKCADCGGAIAVGEPVLLRQFKPHHPEGTCPAGTTSTPPGDMDLGSLIFEAEIEYRRKSASSDARAWQTWDELTELDQGMYTYMAQILIKRSQKSPTPKPSAASVSAKVTLTPQPPVAIPNGCYTLVKGGSEPVTIKIHTVQESGAAFNGKTVISIFEGFTPAGKEIWTAFAFLGDDDRVHMWKRFNDQYLWQAAAEALLDADLQVIARQRYHELQG